MSRASSLKSQNRGGVTKVKMVAARLLPEEREELERLAERDHRTLSAMLRVVYLRGVEHYRSETHAS